MEVELIESARSAIDYIISSENFKTPPEINIRRGSEEGDGYSTNTYAVTIKGKDRKAIEIFVKCVPEMINEKYTDALEQGSQTEFNFYDAVYPAFSRFQEDKGIKRQFDNVPKHYRTNIKKSGTPPIVLEKLRNLGYTLRDRKKPVDDDHLKLPIKAFARYHAISYAMKDQEPELFRKLSADMVDYFTESLSKFGMLDVTVKCINELLEGLNPISDKKILDRAKNLGDILREHSLNIPKNVDEYAVIGQGDCWSSNMMFLYDDKTGVPLDVKLIDWQCQRLNSPVLDFANFFYTLATKEVLDNADYYLNIYYDTLSERIKELGTDPKKTFPHEVFIAHWRKFSLFGLTMAFCIVKIQLFEKGEMPDFINNMETTVDVYSIPIKHQDKYIERMKNLVEHFIDKGLL